MTFVSGILHPSAAFLAPQVVSNLRIVTKL